MRPQDVTETLKNLIPTRRPIYLWGAPGCGKSSIVHQATQAQELEMIDVRAVLLDPVDLRGLPKINGSDRAHWCPPAFLPHDPKSKGVLFLDELAQAPPLVQAGCLQLTLDRRIGEYQLPDGWTVVAASNRQEDRAGVHKLISPLLNRFIHLDLEVSHEDWQAWALDAQVAPEVRSFLHFKPALLHNFDPSAGARAFPTPRSWSFVSDVLPASPPNLLHAIAAGCVGEGPAAEFVAFVQIYRDLPDVEQVLKNPEKAKVPKEPSVLYALCGAIAEKCRQAEAKLLESAFTYADRLPSEFSVLLVRDMVRINRAALTTQGATRWLKSKRDLIL